MRRSTVLSIYIQSVFPSQTKEVICTKPKPSAIVPCWCHDILHNDILHNDTQHNDTQHKDAKIKRLFVAPSIKDIHSNDTKHWHQASLC